jgi:hypothetical protein
MKNTVLFVSIVALMTLIGCDYERTPENTAKIDKLIFEKLKPVKVDNCTLKRYGHANDGGYLMCEERLTAMGANAAAYSYGIEGRDDFGCQLEKEFGFVLHQYDPFDTRRPSCNTGRTNFYEEGIDGRKYTSTAGMKFNTLENHVTENSDITKKLVVKMDVEGAEWESLANTPDSVFDQISQLAVEFHFLYDVKLSDSIEKVLNRLSEKFYVVHVHTNNNACGRGSSKFPTDLIEVTYLNKNLAAGQAPNEIPTLPHALDTPSNTGFFYSPCDLSKSHFE